MENFNLYAKYYDLLYNEKGYEVETDYIIQLIKKYSSFEVRDILNLGCGTGKHDYFFNKRGYNVDGVDVSNEMILLANQNYGNLPGVQFFQGDITKWQQPEEKKYDVVISLFHVMSYQTSNESLLSSFHTAYYHLKSGGLFIFDCWYGPGVFTEKPEVRVKRLDNEEVSVIRISEPKQHYNENIVDVHFDVHITDKKTNSTEKVHEVHSMRYFFMPELSLFASLACFEILDFLDWMRYSIPTKNSWNILGVLKK